MSFFCLTSDFDWAPQEVVDYFLEILNNYSVPATLFLTNKINLPYGNHEIAIHPNFLSNNYEKHISELLEIYPNAKGVRSHSLFFTERLRPVYERFEIEYQSNVMMYFQKNIQPFMISKTTVEIPLCWMDMFYMEMESAPSFKFSENYLSSAGLKVFDFHPIHVFLNTCSHDHYVQAKQHYQNSVELVKHRNTMVPGVKDMLIQLLEFVSKDNTSVKLLLDINREFHQIKNLN